MARADSERARRIVEPQETARQDVRGDSGGGKGTTQASSTFHSLFVATYVSDATRGVWLRRVDACTNRWSQLHQDVRSIRSSIRRCSLGAMARLGGHKIGHNKNRPNTSGNATAPMAMKDKGKVGGREGTRTPDPLLAKQVLCQLSYTPTVEKTGLSLPALAALHRRCILASFSNL